MNLTWMVSGLILNLFQGFLFTGFLALMLTPPEKHFLPEKKLAFLWYVLCSLSTAAALSSYLFFPMPKWDLWVFIFLIIYVLVFLKGVLLQKIYWFLVMLAVSRIVTGIWSFLAKLLSERIPAGSGLSQDTLQFLLLLGANATIFVALFLLIKAFRKSSQKNNPSYLLLITYFLCLVLADLFYTLSRIYQVPQDVVQFGCLITLLIAVMAMLVQKTVASYERREQEYRFREQILQGSSAQAEEMKEMYGSMQQLRHDMNAYVQDIRELIRSGEMSEEPKYFEKLEEQLKAQYSTGNLALDSVLSVKVSKIRQMEIEFKGSNLHYMGGMNITDSALCSLISNMLDNACEALNDRKDRPGERFIYLQFSYTPGGLMIICENPLLGVLPKMQRRSFLSTKKSVYHGLGISIMQKIAEDAGGQFDIALADDLFRILVLIPPAECIDGD